MAKDSVQDENSSGSASTDENGHTAKQPPSSSTNEAQPAGPSKAEKEPTQMDKASKLDIKLSPDIILFMKVSLVSGIGVFQKKPFFKLSKSQSQVRSVF